MSDYETISIVISCVAAFISLWVWRGQRKLQQEANDLQRATAKLAEKQLQILLREEQGKNKARIALRLIRADASRHSYRFQLTNISEVDARDVAFKLLLEDRQSPLIAADYEDRFPLKCLTPGSSVSCIAAITFQTPSAFGAIVDWTNPDGSQESEETYLALP